jgi:hypothetical protein
VTPGYCDLKNVTVAHIGADGKYPAQASGAFEGLGRWSGTLSGTMVGTVTRAPQDALVVTLLTARTGATGKGRVFLPAPAVALDSTFRYPLATVTSVADAVRNWITDFQGYAGAGPVVVASSKGYLSPVTGLRVGRVSDTHRSRRTNMLEDYYTRGLAAV